MKNFLSKLWSLSRTDRVRTLAIDAVSLPSFCRVNMLKLVSVLVLILTIGVGNAWGATVTYSTSDFSGGGESGKNGEFSVTQHSPISVNAVGYKGSDHIRFYSGGKMTISGATITQVVFTCESNAYATALARFTFSSGSCTASSSTATWKGSTTSLTITSNAQTRYTQFVVTYTPSAASHTLSSSVSPSASGSVSLSATSVAEGSTATATATPATHYVFDHWSISGTGSTLSSTTTNPTTVTMGTANTTVTATFVAVPKASITLSEAGATTTDATTYYVGDSYTLPSSTEASCGDKVLVGWSTVEVAETNTKPTSNYYEKGASVTLAASQTFYAVFASVTEGTGDWEQCTSSTIADGDYLIVQSDYMMTNTLNSQRFNRTYIAISAGVISYDAKADWSAYTWHIAETSTSGIFTIKNGDSYVIGTGTASKIDLVSTPADDKELFAITYQSTPGTYKIVSKYNEAASVNRWLRNGGSYFACYADGGYPYLFKRGSGYGNYCTTCAVTHTVSAVVNPAGKATVTLGATTVAEGGTTTATYSAITTGYEFVNWTISGTGATLSSTTANPTTITMGTANVTVTANLQCITPSISVHPASKTDYIVGDVATALSVTANAGGASLSYQWQVSNNNSDWSNIAAGDGGTAATYTPSTAAAGTKYYRVKVTNAATGCSTNATSNAATITVTAASGYCISAFNSSNNGITSGFSNGGLGNEYTLSYTIPGKDGSSNWPQYWIGENEAWASFSANALFADMHFTHSDATLGLAEGATGKLHIWDDNKASGSNLWVKFEPSGYGLRWGGAGEWDQAANTKAFTVDPGDANVYWTDIVTLDGTNNTTWNYYVGLQTASGYVYSGVDNEASDSRGISRTRSVTAMKVSNGTAGSWKGTYLSSEPTGSRGKFRIWNNNIDDYNFYCHWVPFYRVTYDGSGASGSTAASADVCCEGNAAARTVVAASNGFTVPTGKTFGGWASSPENAAAGVVAYAAGADVVLTQSIVLYAIWTDINYTVTVNQNPSVGATTTGQTTTAHYNGTINLTTTVPSGYRFVNWTSSDVTITNPTSATTASFTMPNKNVTVTANFQQTHTVDWYVGGSAPANKIGDDGQTTVVDHGGKISNFPAHDPDGSACDKEFVGWTNTSSYVHGTSPLFNDVAGSPTINADASFYAVFATGGDYSWTRVTSVATITGGGTFIIGYEDDYENNPGVLVPMRNNDLSDASTSADGYIRSGTTNGSSTSGTITMSSLGNNGGDDYEVNISAGTASGTIAIKLAGGNYIGKPSSGNKVRLFTAKGAGSTDITPVIGDDDVVRLKFSNDSALSYNSSTGQERFARYKSQKDVVLYKKTGGYSGYTITCADCGSSVTPTYTAAPAGGTVSVTKSASPVASGSTVKTCTAVDLTVTITPAPHYTLTGFTATGLSTGTATISPAVGSTLPKTTETTFTVTVSSGATGTLNLTPTFTAQTPLSITLETHSKGTFTPIGDIYSGESFTFPTVTPSDAECSSFLGWIEGTTWSGDGTETDPTAITGLANYHAAGSSSGTLTSNKTYTAVYGEKDTQVVPAYQKVTSAPSNWSGDYLIVRDDNSRAFDGSLSTLDAADNYIGVTISDGSITANSTVNASKWTIAKVGETSNYTIKSASGYYIGRTANSNGLNSSTSEEYTNTLAYSTDHVDITSSAGPKLQMNGGTRFRYYGTSQQVLQLYKYNPDAEVVAYTYCTNPACTPRYRVTVNSATGGSPAADKTYEHAAETITLTANPGAGYSFTEWAMENSSTHADATSLLSSSTAATATFSMPAYDVTVTATYAKKMVSTLEVKDGETVVSTTTGPVSGTLNVSTGANKTLTVVVTPADAYDHSWTATVTAGGTYASITNVQAGTFQVSGLVQGDATVTVTAPNDGDAKTVTFTVHVTDILPTEVVLKRDGSSTPISELSIYEGQYVKVNVSFTPTPTNKDFSVSADGTFVTIHAQAHTNPNYYATLNGKKVTTSPVNVTFTSAATSSVTKNLVVTVLPLLTDTFVDYIHGQATQTVSARLSADKFTLYTDINTPSLSDASDADPTSADCETSHYHLIGWLPKATAEALWAAGTAITESTEGLVKAGVQVEATGQTWYAIWGKEQ